jgi:hypothetical protein
MTTKQAFVLVNVRDAETNEVVSIHEAVGTTDNDGETVTILHGYVPTIEQALPADITVKVRPYDVENTPASLLSRLDNPEANLSVLEFAFPS